MTTKASNDVACCAGNPTSSADYPMPLDGPSYKVIPNPSSRKMVVFFSGTDKNNGRFDWWNVGRRQNANVLLVNGGINGWYQSGIPGLGTSIDETVKSFRRWADILQCTEIYTVGVSMGGYGAVLYGTKLDAPVLAFGLDTILKIPGSRSAKRMPKDVRVVVPDLKPVIASSDITVTVVAGEADVLDVVGAAHIYGTPHAEVITLRGVGHGAPSFIDSQLGLSDVVTQFSEGKRLPTFEDQGGLAARKDVVDLLHQALLHQKGDQWETAEQYARAARALAPDCETALHLIGCCAQERGDYMQAVEMFSIVSVLVPHFPNPHVRLGTCLRKLKRPRKALAAYLKYLELNPDSAATNYNVACLYESFNERDAALTYLKRAVELDGENESYQTRLAKFDTAICPPALRGEVVEAVRDSCADQRLMAMRTGY